MVLDSHEQPAEEYTDGNGPSENQMSYQAT